MSYWHEQSATHRAFSVLGVLCWLNVLVGTARCTQDAGPRASPASATLRVGIGGLPLSSAEAGLLQVVGNQSFEGLVNLNEDGRPRPFLAESWVTALDGSSLTVRLREKAKFHDGTSVTAPIIAQALQESLPRFMGPAFEDVEQITALDDSQVQIRLRKPSRFLLEALELTLQKPGKEGIGTGAYQRASSAAASELRANTDYYLGRPAIDRIAVSSYPSVRAAWAELLRGNLDMLYEVNNDALDSLQASSNVAVFSFVRHYQYVIVFGSQATQLKPAAIRRELNAAIDRDAIVRDAFNGHGLPSTGPVPPQHWAFRRNAPRIAYNRQLATNLAQRHLQFTCLVPADSVYERVALVVKRQLAAASVDMRVEEVTQDQILEAGRTNSFEAILTDVLSGPSAFRSYRLLDSKVPFNPKPLASPLVEAALGQVRHALSDDEYSDGVTALQRAVIDDPPVLFLAWGERARAVSRRFDVPAPEDGRDVLSTLRLWHPAADQRATSGN